MSSDNGIIIHEKWSQYLVQVDVFLIWCFYYVLFWVFIVVYEFNIYIFSFYYICIIYYHTMYDNYRPKVWNNLFLFYLFINKPWWQNSYYPSSCPCPFLGTYQNIIWIFVLYNFKINIFYFEFVLFVSENNSTSSIQYLIWIHMILHDDYLTESYQSIISINHYIIVLFCKWYYHLVCCYTCVTSKY